MAREDVYGFIGDRYVLAPGAIAQVGPLEGMNAVSIKLLEGGTLEIGGFSMIVSSGFTVLAGSGSNLASVGQTFAKMYPLQANEIFSGNVSGKIFLYASSATCVAAIAIGRSQGY